MFIISIVAMFFIFTNSVSAQENHVTKMAKKTHLGIEKNYLAIGRIGTDFPCGEAIGISLQDASRYIFSSASPFNATLATGSDHEIVFPEDGTGGEKTGKTSMMSYVESYSRIKNLKVGYTNGFYGSKWTIPVKELQVNYPSNIFPVNSEGNEETAIDYSNMFFEMLISIQQLSKENEQLKEELTTTDERLVWLEETLSKFIEDPRSLNDVNKNNYAEISPNPSIGGQISIKYQLDADVKAADLKIYDINGRIIQTIELDSSNTKRCIYIIM